MTTSNAFKPLTKDDIADVLGISLRSIENWVNDGTLPAPKKLGNRVYWHPNAFYAWLDHRLTADAADEPAERATPVPYVKQHKAKPQAQAKAAKTQMDTLLNRTQAKLDAMLA